ncbi:MAG TPA: glycosyltransferase family A protein [Terriglobales bacterium]|nr:glycosyltransferase family A protein [Terriglobales bacterium]
MKPLVSILIPAYNAERWIGDTMRSALAQTWPRKEIIIVDDGSQDRTVEIARQFASPNVSVITQQNQGAPAARNKAFELCQGDYIQWLDADDLLSPDKVARQMAKAEECQDKRTLLSSGWAWFTYRPWKANFVPTALWCDLTPLEWMLRKWEQNLHMQTATWLVSRELTELAGPWDTRLMGDDDGEYFCRVLFRSSGVRFVTDAKVYYRITGSNRWSYIGLSNKKMEAHALGMRLQIGYVRSVEDSERVRAACLNYLQTWLIYFYPDRADLVSELRNLAKSVDGDLEIPAFSWKYDWIQKLFGFAAAKRAQLLYNQVKSSVLGASDKVMCLIDSAGKVSS